MRCEVVLAAPGEHPIRHAQHVVGELVVQPRPLLCAPRLARRVRQHGDQGRGDRGEASQDQHRDPQPKRQRAGARHERQVEDAAHRQREQRPQIQVLDMPHILGEQPEDVAGGALRAERHRLALGGAVQAQAQRARHAQNPIMARQPFEVVEDRLADAEQAHQPQRHVENEDRDHERRAADQIPGGEHERRREDERRDAERQSEQERAAVLPEERLDPRVAAQQRLTARGRPARASARGGRDRGGSARS